MDVGYVPVAEQTSAAYPLRLTTGRMHDQWHTMSRSGLAPALNRHVEEPFVYLHPGDMQRRKIVNDTLLNIKTKRCATILPAMWADSLQSCTALLHLTRRTA